MNDARLGSSLALLIATLAFPARAELARPTDRIGVDEHVGAELPLGVTLRDQDDRRRTLAESFDGKRPVILQFAYYHCPMLCDLTLRELALRLRELGWKLGDDYTALTISIDPSDNRLVAGAKREKVLGLLPSHADAAWPFFVSDQSSIAALTERAGYRYYRDDSTGQYAHPAVTLILTPQGKIARYLYGPLDNAQDLGLALREARAGRGGTTALVDRVILSCFHYDPSTRRYALLIGGVMRGGAALIALGLAVMIFVFVRRGRARLHAL
jgi:protein SCO1/2